jgi:hypothetical protein
LEERIMIMLSLLAAIATPPPSYQAVAPSPPIAADVARLFEAIPEVLPENGGPASFALPAPAADWLGRLTGRRQRDVALVILLSYSLPADQETSPKAPDAAQALAFLAAETARAAPGQSRRNAGPPRAERQARAARALAWGARLGICDAAFVDTLRSLPPPAAPGEPDLRPVVRDLGMLAYTSGKCSNDVSGGAPPK